MQNFCVALWSVSVLWLLSVLLDPLSGVTCHTVLKLSFPFVFYMLGVASEFVAQRGELLKESICCCCTCFAAHEFNAT